MSPSALVIGAGPRIGKALAETLTKAGYRVALASRAPKDALSQYKYFPVDLSKPETVAGLFETVTKSLGAPSLVVYNTGSAHFTKPEDPLNVSLEDFNLDNTINLTSLFESAKGAVKGFESAELGPEGATFIYTGNCTNVTPLPMMMSATIGKSGGASLIHTLAVAYKGRPYKFYYGDERKDDGSPAFADVHGDAHAKHYLQLAQNPEQQPWQQTFTPDKGYVKF